VNHDDKPIISAIDTFAHTSCTPRSSVSIEQFAHELNSLLDGSMRSLRQARQRLIAQGESDQSNVNPDDPERHNDAIEKLDRAAASMHQMAAMLERAMTNGNQSRASVLAADRPLGALATELIASLRAQAEEHQITINLSVANDVAGIPAGALGTVLSNGLNNAIAACTRSTTRARLIDVSIFIGRGPAARGNQSELVMLITDTGPGITEAHGHDDAASRSHGGHGIGLGLCRQIVSDLDGTITLTNIPFGAGAIFQARVPLPRLRAA
jgi:signal transduction histidine kinase